MEFENFIEETEKEYHHQADIVNFMSFLYYQITKGILCSHDIFEYINNFKINAKMHGGTVDIAIKSVTPVKQLMPKGHMIKKNEILANAFTKIIANANAKPALKKFIDAQLEKNDELFSELKEFVSSKIVSQYKISEQKAEQFVSILKNRIITNTFSVEALGTDLHYLDLETMTFNMSLNKPAPEINTLISIIIENQPTLYNYYVNYTA
jgi:hypothetical protein